MKVKDLIIALNKLNPNLEVVGYCEDASFESDANQFRLFELNSVQEIEGERLRNDDHVPTIKFGKSSASGKLALLDMTSDF